MVYMNSKPEKKKSSHPWELRHQTPLERGAKWLRKDIPQTNLNWKNCSIVGLLVATIYRLRFVGSVFLCLREDLKEKSGRLKDFFLPVSPLHFILFSFFSNGPGRTVMCGLYIYTSQYLKENFTVRCIIFSLRTDIGKQTITFFATNNNNPIFHYKYKR